MSFISDFKSSPFNVFTQGTSVSTGTGVLVPECSSMLGQQFSLADGREVRLVQNAATALVSGTLVQSPATTANHQNLTVAVPTATPATAGTFAISVTLGATLVKSNEYVGGLAIVNAGTGIGQTFRIASHPNAAASAAGFIVTLEDPIGVTLTTSSRLSLIRNPYQNVIVNPTTVTGTPVGVTMYPVAASVAPTTDGTSGLQTAAGTQQYAFIVSKGVTGVLSDASAPGVGKAVCPSTVTAGAIMVHSPVTTTGDAIIGRTAIAATSAEAKAVFVDM